MAHTQIGRPTYEAHTREYTHKHTHTQTNTQRGPTKYGAACGYTLHSKPFSALGVGPTRLRARAETQTASFMRK